MTHPNEHIGDRSSEQSSGSSHTLKKIMKLLTRHLVKLEGNRRNKIGQQECRKYGNV